MDPLRKSKFSGFQSLQASADVKDPGAVKPETKEGANAATKH
jgi:hypothetical protein